MPIMNLFFVIFVVAQPGQVMQNNIYVIYQVFIWQLLIFLFWLFWNNIQMLTITKKQPEEDSFKIKVNELLQEVVVVTCKYSFEEILKFYKAICLRLNYFLNKLLVDIFNTEQYQKIIRQITKNLYMLVDSTEYMKYGHRLPMIMYTIKKLEKMIVGQKSLPLQKSMLQRRQTYQRSDYYRKTILKQIKQKQIDFLKTGQINQCISCIAQNQLILPDAQCICCSKIFIKNFQLINHNPCIPNLVGLTQKQTFSYDFIYLYKALSAVCNNGGGVIIIGAQQKKKGSFITNGILFGTNDELQDKKFKIQQLIKNHIRPIPHFNVECVHVHSNFVDKQNVNEQIFRYCFRISVFMPQLSYFSYVEIAQKGYHKLFKSYYFDQKKNVIQIMPGQNTHLFYEKLCQHHKKFKDIFYCNSHQNMVCNLPVYQTYSSIFIDMVNKGLIIFENTEKTEELQSIQELKFPYTFTSLLVVGSKQKQRHIKDLRTYMKNKKYIFQATKPFQQYFKEGARVIWMLSHADKHDFIKSVIKQFDTGAYITMIPVYKTLQIDEAKITPKVREALQTKFLQKYPQGFTDMQGESQNDNGVKKPVIFFSFDCYSHSIFAYLIFESLQLRPYFVRENSYYKKKPQYTSG